MVKCREKYPLLWRPTRHSPRPFALPVSHKWLTNICQISSPPLCRRLLIIQENTDIQRPYFATEGLGKSANTSGMNFNTNKCHILSIKNKTQFFYSLNNETLENVTNNPYLGITISNDIEWHSHISTITKNANSTLGFLRRNIRRCPINSKRTAYIALVRAVLEYGAIVWDPYHRGDIDKLEKIHHRSACFITGVYRSRHPGSVTTMLTNLNLDTRRRDQRLKCMYRTVRRSIPALPTETFFRPQITNIRHVQPKHFPDHVSSNVVQQLTTNNTICFIVPTAHTEQFKNNFL